MFWLSHVMRHSKIVQGHSLFDSVQNFTFWSIFIVYVAFNCVIHHVFYFFFVFPTLIVKIETSILIEVVVNLLLLLYFWPFIWLSISPLLLKAALSKMQIIHWINILSALRMATVQYALPISDCSVQMRLQGCPCLSIIFQLLHISVNMLGRNFCANLCNQEIASLETLNLCPIEDKSKVRHTYLKNMHYHILFESHILLQCVILLAEMHTHPGLFTM